MLFELESVALHRGGEPVLRGLSTSLPDGISAVVGPSGSGKSTMLRLLNRLSDPEGGSVRFRGTDTLDLDPLELRRRVALVPQLPALLPGSVADNLRFASGFSGADPDAGELLDLAGLDLSFADRDVRRLSVGEQQRAMLARALATQPDVLLLDEPTSALDEPTRDSIERTVAGLRRRLGTSVVIVTHDPAQAHRLADWMVELDQGRRVREGSLREAIA